MTSLHVRYRNLSAHQNLHVQSVSLSVGMNHALTLNRLIKLAHRLPVLLYHNCKLSQPVLIASHSLIIVSWMVHAEQASKIVHQLVTARQIGLLNVQQITLAENRLKFALET